MRSHTAWTLLKLRPFNVLDAKAATASDHDSLGLRFGIRAGGYGEQSNQEQDQSAGRERDEPHAVQDSNPVRHVPGE